MLASFPYTDVGEGGEGEGGRVEGRGGRRGGDGEGEPELGVKIMFVNSSKSSP